MSYRKRSIQPDDSVISIVYQPERCIQELNLFNRNIFRRYSTDHLSILTDKELIYINEEKQTRNSGDKFYGGVYTYIPRRQIQDISFSSSSGNLICIMKVNFPDDTCLISEFSLANEELIQLQDSLR